MPKNRRRAARCKEHGRTKCMQKKKRIARHLRSTEEQFIAAAAHGSSWHFASVLGVPCDGSFSEKRTSADSACATRDDQTPRPRYASTLADGECSSIIRDGVRPCRPSEHFGFACRAEPVIGPATSCRAHGLNPAAARIAIRRGLRLAYEPVKVPGARDDNGGGKR